MAVVFAGRNFVLLSCMRGLSRRGLYKMTERALSVSSMHWKADKITHTGQVWLTHNQPVSDNVDIPGPVTKFSAAMGGR